MKNIKDVAKKLKEVDSVQSLLNFLEMKGNNHENYHHYTNIDSLIHIISSGYFHLTKGNSISINDQHEAKMKGSYDMWQKTYIGSFAFGESENMAMWGLYGLPWEDAVRITIPRKIMKEWISQTNEVFGVNQVDGGCERVKLAVDANIKLSDIIYINGKRNSNSSKLSWSNESINIDNNSVFSRIDTRSEMTGFIKNEAWKYENEVRIHIQTKDPVEHEKIAIKIPDEVISSMVITKGPYFCGDLMERVENRYQQMLYSSQINDSGFKDLVRYRTLCSLCQYSYLKKRIY